MPCRGVRAPASASTRESSLPASSAQLSQQESAICADIASRASTMLEDLRTHVAIPTGGVYTPGLDEYRGILLERIVKLGAAVELKPGKHKPEWLYGVDPGEPVPPIAVCRRPTRTIPRILIACHIDTVFDPRGHFRELAVAPDGRTATGPGVVDMKGGILIALNALEALAQAGVDVSWTLLLNSDEETGSYQSEHILQHEAREHDLGICTEPALAGGELAIERMGSGQFQIETIGRAAHVGRAFTEGISAVTALAETLVQVAQIADPANGRIVSVGPIEGGDATNAVPDRARAWGNARYPTKEIGDELGAALDALQRNLPPGPAEAAHLGEDPDETEHPLPRVNVRRSFNRPAKPLTPEVESLAQRARAAAESLGQRLPFAKTGGVCDGNILQAAGLPTVDTLGVRGGGLHTPKEWIEIPSLVERSQLMAVLLSRLAGGDPGPT